MFRNHWGQLILLITLSYIVFSSNISGIDLYAFDEARNAGCAWEMKQNNEWLIPSFNGELRYHKPPLHYYFMIAGYDLLGYNGFGARFFSPICGVFSVLIIFFFCNKYFNNFIGLLASVALISSFHFAIQMHMAVPDPYLVLLLTAGLLLLYHAAEKRSLFSALCAYVFIGLATLTKGPVAIVIGATGVLIYLILTKQFKWKVIQSFKPLPGIAIMLLVSLPWYIYIGNVTSGAFTEGFFLVHNIQRFMAPMEGHGGTFLLTWLFVIIGMLPLSIYIIQSFYTSWKARLNDPPIAFVLSCALSVIIIFSISRTKLPNYTIPAYPFLAILIAYTIDKLRSKTRLPIHLKISSVSLILITLAILIITFFAFRNNAAVSHLRFHSLLILPVFIGAVIATIYIWRNDAATGVFIQCFSMIIVTLLIFWIAYPQFDKTNPVRVLKPLMNDSENIWGYKLYNPAFIIANRNPIPTLNNRKEVKELLSKNESGYLITRERYDKELEAFDNLVKIGSQKDLFELSTSVIYKFNHD